MVVPLSTQSSCHTALKQSTFNPYIGTLLTSVCQASASALCVCTMLTADVG